MMLAARLFSKLFSQPLVLHGPSRAGLERSVIHWMNAAEDAAAKAAIQSGGHSWRMAKTYEKVGSLAVIHIDGYLDKEVSDVEVAYFGACDLADVDKALALAAADEKIDTVLLAFNSPGGGVTGVPETAARIARLRARKEVHAYTATMCCSGAIWLASQADYFAAAPSSTIGSIGVYMALLDQSRALEMEGLKINLLKAGRLKAMGASFKPLEEEERAIMQASVDKTHSQFKAAITTLRQVKDEDMQGQWFDGTEAKSKGLVNETTNQSLEEWISELAA